jgi:hypothetical protein
LPSILLIKESIYFWLFLVNFISCFIDSVKKLSIIRAKTVVQQLNAIKIGLFCVQKVTIKCTLANILFLVIVWSIHWQSSASANLWMELVQISSALSSPKPGQKAAIG